MGRGVGVSHNRLNRKKDGLAAHSEALDRQALENDQVRAKRKAWRMQRFGVVPENMERCFEDCWRLFRMCEESRKGMMSGRIEFSRHRETVKEFKEFQVRYWLALVDWCGKHGKHLPPV